MGVGIQTYRMFHEEARRYNNKEVKSKEKKHTKINSNNTHTCCNKSGEDWSRDVIERVRSNCEDDGDDDDDDICFDLMDGHVCICVNIEVSMNSRKF